MEEPSGIRRPTLRHDADDTLSSRELLVADALAAHEAEFGSLYEWAAATVRARKPDGWVHLVAHYVRDLLNRLPEHFDVPAADRASVDELLAELDERWAKGVTDLDEDLTNRIEALLTAYRRGGENQEERVEAVLTATARDSSSGAQIRAGIRAWRQLHRYFQKLAHIRSHEKGARLHPIDEDEVSARFEALTALLAARIAGEGFFQTLADLEALAEIGEPSREQAEQAAAAMRDGLADAFLARLRSPGWLPELERLDVFSQPPPAVREQGYVQAPYWAAAEYLARIAAQAPNEVLATIQRIPAGDNERVEVSFAEAALQMPPDEAAELSVRVRDALEQHGSVFGLAEVAAQLAAKLAGDGKLPPARRLMEAALGLRVVEAPTPRVVGRVDEWDVEEVLSTHFDAFVKADPIAAAGFLMGPLERLTARINELAGYEQDSSILRPAIEDHEQNIDIDARGALIRGLRDVGERIVADYPADTARLLEILSRGPSITRRIALHLLRLDISDGAAERRRPVLMDSAGYEDTETHHERFLLLAGYYSELSEEDRKEVAEAIAEGPDRDRLFGPPGDEPDVETRRDVAAADWQLRWFAAMGDLLPGAQQTVRDALEERYGPVEHPEFLGWHESWVGPTSPEPAADLKDMTVAEVIQRLTDFQGGQGPATPSREGLGRVFGSVVAEAPDRWAEAAELLLEVPPIYARHFFEGLDHASRGGQQVSSWPEILTLADKLVSQGPAPRVTSSTFDQEEQPGHVRAALARLLTGALANGQIPYECRERVWELLAELSVDPDPGEEYERLRREGRDAGYSPAVASVRGSAIEGAIVYAQWVAHHQRERGRDASIAAVPEFSDLLVARLGDGGETSPGVLGVIGASLPLLVRLDRNWAAEQLPRLLSPAASTDPEAVWRAYVVWAPLYEDTFNLVVDRYRAAVADLPGVDDRRYVEHLGQQLALAAIHNLPSASELLDQFFENASAEARKRLTGWIGRIANPANHQGLAPTMREHRAQLRELWHKRLEAVDDGDTELVEFGWWYGSGVFDAPEDLDRLVATVKRAGGQIENIRAVLRHAAATAAAAPESAAELTEAIVEVGGAERFYVAGAMLPLLQALLTDERTRDRARAVIDELGETGFLGAGRLLHHTS